MYRSKSYWGYERKFMEKFMVLFQMTTEYLERNTVKLFYISEHDQCEKAIGFIVLGLVTKR